MTAPRTRCPGCLRESARRTFHVDGKRFRRCGACQTLFLEEPPEPEAVEALYQDERYFANPEYRHDYCGYKDYLADREQIEEKFHRVLARVEREVAPGRLLDVGSGPGFLLTAAESRGWEGRGLEVNPWAARYGREELGVDVEPSGLADAGFPDAHFDVVTMMDLIEHFAEPQRQVDEAARVLRPGGILVVLTPDAGSPATRLLGRRWPEVQLPEHIVLFSVEGLAEMLRRSGLETFGWHWIGKRSTLSTLVADLRPVAPRLSPAMGRVLEASRLGGRRFEFDPRAKFVLYSRRPEPGRRPAKSRPRRLSKRTAGR